MLMVIFLIIAIAVVLWFGKKNRKICDKPVYDAMMAWFLIDAYESAAIKELIRFESVPGVDDEVENALHEAIFQCRKNARLNYQSALKKEKEKKSMQECFLPDIISK